MEDPPRSALTATALPTAVERRQKPQSLVSEAQRRANIGSHIFTVSVASGGFSGTGRRLYESGQLLDFVEEQAASELQPVLVSNRQEVRHDTNAVDNSVLGLSDELIASIASAATSQFETLTDYLNQLLQSRSDLETQITENKKKQNQLTKALTAIKVLPASDTLAATQAQLENDLATLQTQYAALVADANTTSVAITSTKDDIIALAPMVT